MLPSHPSTSHDGNIRRAKYDEEAMETAMELVLSDEMTITEASKNMGVPRSSLATRVKKIKREQSAAKKSRAKNILVLSEEHERKFGQWLCALCNMNHCQSWEYIVEVAESLCESSTTELAVTNWIKCYCKKYPHMLSTGVLRKLKPSAFHRDLAEDWFTEFHSHLKMEGLDASLFLNADYEHRVFVYNRVFIPFQGEITKINEERKSLPQSFMCISSCVNSGGTSLKALFSYTDAKSELWETDPFIYLRSCFSQCTKESDHFFDWLQYFILCIDELEIGRPMILFLDSPLPIVSMQASDLAVNSGIIFHCLPCSSIDTANSPLKLQLLKETFDLFYKNLEDVGSLFGVFIPKLFLEAWECMVTGQKIKKSFQEAGLVPFNPTVVYEHIKGMEDVYKLRNKKNALLVSKEATFISDKSNIAKHDLEFLLGIETTLAVLECTIHPVVLRSYMQCKDSLTFNENDPVYNSWREVKLFHERMVKTFKTGVLEDSVSSTHINQEKCNHLSSQGCETLLDDSQSEAPWTIVEDVPENFSTQEVSHEEKNNLCMKCSVPVLHTEGVSCSECQMLFHLKCLGWPQNLRAETARQLTLMCVNCTSKES